MAAAAIDNVATMRLLINADVDVNARCAKYGTALIAAVANDNLAAVFTLLEAGADVDLCGLADESPVQVAAKRENEHIVTRLLGKGANIDKSLKTVEEYMEVYHTTREIARLLYNAKANRNFLGFVRAHPHSV